MSDPVTALSGAHVAAALADIAELGPSGMITLRGDLSSGALNKAAQDAVGADVPEQRRFSVGRKGGIAWMSPDELLLLCPYEDVQEVLTRLHSALEGQHALAVNVSDARAMFRVTGPHMREVLAKLMPVDLHPDHFGHGDVRRTRLAQVPAAMWMPEPETAQIICFRSVAQYVFDVLKVAAQEGAEVGYF